MMASDEKEEMFDDWEDEGFPSDDNDGFPEDADDGAFENAVPQQKPAKKKGGGGILLFLLILLGGAGGGFYYLTTPAGAPYRDYLPEAVRGFLPASEAPKPKVAGTPEDQHVADVLDGEMDTSGTQEDTADIDPLGFQAPPMPSLSDAEDTAAAGDMTTDTENVESFASFDEMAKDEAADDEAVDDAGEVAWGSDTPSEESVTALSFDSTDDTEVAAVDETPAPLAVDEAAKNTDSLTNDMEKAPENTASSFNTATNQMPAVKSEQVIDLEDRMSVLENAVHSLEKTVVTKKDLSGLKSNVSSLQADIKALRSELKKTASVARSAASAPRAVSPSSVSTTTTKPVKTATAAPKREWVMVSAQPGTAWISEKGSSSKREISVGDTVPGLGRITSIAPSAGSGLWIVKGTKGTLQQ